MSSSPEILKDAVVEAAMQEVLAQGYRSSDMARALKALKGEFWFEVYVGDGGVFDANARRSCPTASD